MAPSSQRLEPPQNPGRFILQQSEPAKQFAQMVLTSGANGGLIYGIDAPWGTGKTSFINLAQRYWEQQAAEETIVFKLELLRNATDPDLAERFVSELSTALQNKFFIPELPRALSKYSRMLKGKMDFHFLGFKLALEPSSETMDELLGEIDDLLIRIKRKLIVIVDDLDRLDAKAVNNVLFTVKRTFRLSQATYVLCYDTENLLAKHDDAERAREFLEKFVNIKLTLFADVSMLCNFLRYDWNKDQSKSQYMPSSAVLKLRGLLSSVADFLESDKAPQYLPVLGDIRKLKRFVNAALLVGFDKIDLAHTDFIERDLINLLLLYLNYPSIFRKIYAEETGGRSGLYSLKINPNSQPPEFWNEPAFKEQLGKSNGTGAFLLKELFSEETLDSKLISRVSEPLLMTRACFNDERHRNLEKYLKLIVMFAKPEMRETFQLYQASVDAIVRGDAVENVLARNEFKLSDGESAHEKLWRILVNRSRELNGRQADNAISTLVKWLPRYSSVSSFGSKQGLRHSSIYNLMLLLDQVGWATTARKRLANTPENVVEIAYRVFGEEPYAGRGLIDLLASPDRGILGYHDLILFRLQCSADRQGQIYNVYTALNIHGDKSAPTSGRPVIELAIAGMRTISQRVFSLFEARYIDNARNYLDEVDKLSDSEIIGDSYEHQLASSKGSVESEKDFLLQIAGTRSTIKSFIAYQIANQKISGGVSCGYFDRVGVADGGEIGRIFVNYLFEVCFNPAKGIVNYQHFLDYCLSHLTSGFWSDQEQGYFPTVEGLSGVLDRSRLASYWKSHGESIRSQGYTSLSKMVTTLNYQASYAEELPRVFAVLDEIQQIEGSQAGPLPPGAKLN